MKKRVFLFLLILCLMLSFSACSYEFDGDGGASSFFSATCTVTFHPENGEENIRRTVLSGERVSSPADPVCDGKIFLGWFTDPTLTERYDFSAGVTHDLDLYASYLSDYAAWLNRLTLDFVPATVTVYTTSKSGRFGLETTTSLKSGSGVIFYRNANCYYLLTNNHVVTKDADATGVSYKIEDYRGVTYDATNQIQVIASDPDYDLAVVSFAGPTGENALSAVSLGTADPALGSPLAAVGQPSGQKNAVTFGLAESYRVSDLHEESGVSSISFPVLFHTAPISQGSSGGAVVDENLQIVAINFAEASDGDGAFVYGLAVPISRVREFLTKYEVPTGE